MRRKPSCRRARQRASPAPRPARTANRAAEPQAAPSPPRPNRACCPSSPTSSRPSPSCRTRKSAAPAARTLGDLLFSKPGITGSSFAPGASSRPIIRGPRRQSRRHRRERHRRRRRLRSRRGSFRADRSARDQPGRSDPRTGGAALRLDLDRRRRQRHQQPHSGRPALLRGGAVPDATGCRRRRRWRMRNPRPASPSRRAPRSVPSIAASKAASCSMPAAAISRFTPTPMAARPATTASRAIPICSTRPGRCNGRQPNSAAQADGASIGGSYIFHGGFIGAAITQNDCALSHSRHRRRRSPDPDRRAPDQVHRQGRVSAGRGGDRCRQLLGRRDRLQAQRDRPRRSRRSSRPIGVRQTFTNKEQEGRVEVQMTPFNARFAAVTTAFGLQAGHQELTAPSPDDPGSPLNGLWDPNKNTRVAGYVFNEFKFSDTTKAQIAGRIEHVNLSGTTPAFIPDAVRPQRRSRRHRSATRAQPELHAEEREHRPDPESAVAIWSPASPRNMSSARRSPPNCFRAARTMRPPPSTSAIPISASRPPSRSRSDCGGRPGRSGSKPPPTTRSSTASSYRRLTGNTCEDVACVGPADPALRSS